MLSPNGCGLSPDGTILYVADTEGARLWAFDVEAPGVLRAPEPFRPHSGRVIAGLPGNARFDSLAVTASGNIAVATLTTGYVTEFSPAGDLVREVKMPDVYPTNISGYNGFCGSCSTPFIEPQTSKFSSQLSA